MSRMDRANLPTTFGVFSPTGHVVMGFASDAAMAEAREALLSAGFSEDAITAFRSGEVVSDIEKMRSNASLFAMLGNEELLMKQHAELARQGGRFLVVQAPGEPEVDQAVDLARSYGLKLAHKYNRLTLQELE